MARAGVRAGGIPWYKPRTRRHARLGFPACRGFQPAGNPIHSPPADVARATRRHGPSGPCERTRWARARRPVRVADQAFWGRQVGIAGAMCPSPRGGVVGPYVARPGAVGAAARQPTGSVGRAVRSLHRSVRLLRGHMPKSGNGHHSAQEGDKRRQDRGRDGQCEKPDDDGPKDPCAPTHVPLPLSCGKWPVQGAPAMRAKTRTGSRTSDPRVGWLCAAFYVVRTRSHGWRFARLPARPHVNAGGPADMPSRGRGARAVLGCRGLGEGVPRRPDAAAWARRSMIMECAGDISDEQGGAEPPRASEEAVELLAQTEHTGLRRTPHPRGAIPTAIDPHVL